jgi:hypothetical protein
MNKSKNMTPEQLAAWREKANAKQKAWYDANKEKVNAKRKALRDANKEKVNAKQKARRDANKEKVKAYQRAWRDANKEKVKAYQRARSDSLNNKYVSYVIGMKVHEVPPELINLKREQLELKRLVRKLDQSIHETTMENPHVE